MSEKSQSAEKMQVVVKTSGVGVVTTGLLLLVVLFGGGGAWAYYVNLSGAIIAPGKVTVPGKAKTVQHLDGGIVATLNVSDGDVVKQGDVLIQLNDTLLKANQNIYQMRLREGTARKARLIAERDLSQKVFWDDKLLRLLKVSMDPSIKIGQLALFQARGETREGQRNQLNEKIAQFGNQVAGILALKRSKKIQLGYLEQELEGSRSLKKKGLTSASQLFNLERQKQDLVGQIAEHDAEFSRIENSISEIKIQIIQIDREFREKVLGELTKSAQEVNDTTQQLYATTEKLKRIDIKAPVSGIVHELNVFTIGGVIAPGAVIMQIIPQSGKFEIEANVELQFVDQLYPGQPTTVRFSAFNQRTTPVLDGEIRSISADAVKDEQSGQSFYVVNITVPDEQMQRLGDQKLVPGMPAETFIRTRDRTPLNYLLKPLYDQIQRAFREE